MISNPRKVFNFRIEIAGIPQFAVQKVDIPTPEIEAVAHGGSNHDIKTAGRVSVEDLVLTKLRGLPGSDLWAQIWLSQAQSMVTGGGGLAAQYKKTIVVRELDPTNVYTVNTWIFFGAWVKKAKLSELSKTASENTMETVTISVDRMQAL